MAIGSRRARLGAFALVLLCAVVTPYTALAGTHKTHKRPLKQLSSPLTAIAFGQEGGNMRPFTITIGRDGSISNSANWPIIHNTHLYDSRNALAGLAALATASGILSLPTHTSCSGTLPDVAARFVELTTSSGTKHISVRGGCQPEFLQFWAVLASTAGMSF